MKVESPFVLVVHKDFLIIKRFNPIQLDSSRPRGTWEYIDLQRDCTYGKLSEGNEAQPTAIFCRNVLEVLLFVWVGGGAVWSFGVFGY